jgi:hypothetical protein
MFKVFVKFCVLRCFFGEKINEICAIIRVFKVLNGVKGGMVLACVCLKIQF